MKFESGPFLADVVRRLPEAARDADPEDLRAVLVGLTLGMLVAPGEQGVPSKIKPFVTDIWLTDNHDDIEVTIGERRAAGVIFAVVNRASVNGVAAVFAVFIEQPDETRDALGPQVVLAYELYARGPLVLVGVDSSDLQDKFVEELILEASLALDARDQAAKED